MIQNQLHVQRAVGTKGRNGLLRIEYLHLGVSLDVAGRDIALAGGIDIDGLGAGRMQKAMMLLTLRTISVTSSFTPGIVENSCWTPAILMLVQAVRGEMTGCCEESYQVLCRSRAPGAL